MNQCWHNISGSHVGPHANLFNFTFLLVDFTNVLCSSANELQQNSNASSREEYIPPILTVLLEIHRVYIWPTWPFVLCMSFVTTPSTNQRFCPDSGQILRHQHGISVAESPTLFLAKPRVTQAYYLCYVWVSYNLRKYGEHMFRKK